MIAPVRTVTLTHTPTPVLDVWKATPRSERATDPTGGGLRGLGHGCGRVNGGAAAYKRLRAHTRRVVKRVPTHTRPQRGFIIGR